MTRRLAAAVAFLIAGAGAAATLAAPPVAKVNLEEGLWRLDVEMEIPGKGPETGPLRQDICIRPDNVLKLAVPPDSPCTVSGLEITARRMRWKVACEQGPMRSVGEGIMEFGGTALSSALLIKTAKPYPMTIKQSITGNRLGPCPAGTATGASPLKRYAP